MVYLAGYLSLCVSLSLQYDQFSSVFVFVCLCHCHCIMRVALVCGNLGNCDKRARSGVASLIDDHRCFTALQMTKIEDFFVVLVNCAILRTTVTDD